MKNQVDESGINSENTTEEIKQKFNSTTQKNKNLFSKKLDRITEKDEDEDEDEESYNSNKEEDKQIDENTDQKELIKSLKEKISELEEKIFDLKSKNDELKKDNIHTDSKLKRMSFIGVRKKFSVVGTGTQDTLQLANLIKEKNDLQEINEKMLDMLTEKEIQNEELQEDFEAYKAELKSEVQKYLDTIEELEKKNEILEENAKNQENLDERLDDVLNQYNSYKKKTEESMMEYFKNEEDMKKQVEEKENIILKMKIDIQNLELENIQLQNQTEKKEKMLNADIVNYEKVIFENNKLRDDNNELLEKMRQKDEKIQNYMKNKENEINNLNKDLETSKSNLEKVRNDKNNEINLLKNEISKCNKDLNSLIKKNELLIKEDQETKKNIFQMQNKLEKKKQKNYKN